MKKHITYPKITQFRNVVLNVNKQTTFTGLDEDGVAIYDSSIEKPTLTFNGTVKLHGTNSSVCFNDEEGLWTQSRQRIITPENDNAGFAAFVEAHKAEFLSLINDLKLKNQIDTKTYTISIYGEWAGKGIQKGVGICELEKAFYVFAAKISKPKDPEFNAFWIDSSEIRNNQCRIFNIEDFKTYAVDVDFNDPKQAQGRFAEITEEVAKECPVAKSFGIENGIGEGVVWTVEYKGNIHRFKVKGEKHAVTKTKKPANVDVEKLNSIQEFIAYSVTENRFNHAIENVFGKEELDVKKLGEFIKWIVKDIASEEIDTLKENNLKPKEVNKYISFKVREMFFKAYNEF